MSILTIAFPVQAVLPNVQLIAGAIAPLARLLIGLGALIALFMVFKPLMLGLLRAALLVVNPRLSLEERRSRRTLRSMLLVNRLAQDVESSQPGLAAELRQLAAQG
ncbi:MAG TPA: hypothetical protein VGU61_09275 [Noviherbaspirillum sp.]|jgi:hypothetical protein|uniref:hypothetical protein n=1 Tax=Noviherbaspirillum sp. TaxID=1926288 RepID=UPI002DDCF4E6|nr:hypothetical protein [Noviherbaspirillum sp.]HEV2610445.1 hypothetical protein [Noviherbaspirillum sp.]